MNEIFSIWNIRSFYAGILILLCVVIFAAIAKGLAGSVGGDSAIVVAARTFMGTPFRYNGRAETPKNRDWCRDRGIAHYFWAAHIEIRDNSRGIMVHCDSGAQAIISE